MRLLFASLLLVLIPPFPLKAATLTNHGFGYEIDVADDWILPSDMDAPVVSMKTPSGLKFTIWVKNTRKKLRKETVRRKFRAEYRNFAHIDQGVQVRKKPLMAKVGPFPAMYYAFRFTMGDGTPFEALSFWFNTPAPQESAWKLFKIQILAPALDFRREWEGVRAALRTFRVIKAPDTGSPSDVEPGSEATVDVVSGPSGDQSATSDSGDIADNGGESNSEGDRGGNAYPVATGGGNDETDGTGRPLETSYSNEARPAFGSGRRISNLMSRHKRVLTDQNKIARIRKVFGNRNQSRTEEQRRRAMKYFGGFGQTKGKINRAGDDLSAEKKAYHKNHLIEGGVVEE